MNINLIRHRPRKVHIKPSRVAVVRARKNHLEKRVWYICKRQDETVYYVHEVDRECHAIKWSSLRSKAMQFHTENGVHHFIHAYMNDRKDIFLIHQPEVVQ